MQWQAVEGAKAKVASSHGVCDPPLRLIHSKWGLNYMKIGWSVLTACTIVSTASAQKSLSSPDRISIELESPGTRLAAGGGLEVRATITNVSDTTVYLHESALRLTLPMKLEGQRAAVYAYPAFFPTEWHDTKAATESAYFRNVIGLKPGDTYTAFWSKNFFMRTPSPFQHLLRQVSSQIPFLFFDPGEYTIPVTGKYWMDPTLPSAGYRTIAKSFKVTVAAPPVVILFGA
jgi:hypothetical protein